MASYNRLGSFLLADVLATVPSGMIHRAIALTGGAFERHLLLTTFSDELLAAGLAAHGADIQRVIGQLGATPNPRWFGANYQFDARKTPHLTCDYLPGRSLAQVLEKTREEQLPFGVDHALTVLQSMAQAIIVMHDKGVSHGVLSPHSAWVGFEGSVQIIDAPEAAVLKSLLAKAPALNAALEPYRCAAEATPFQRDLFGMGAVCFEMLTLEQLPAGPAIAEALDRATLKAAQEEGGIPAEILALLKRMLLVGQPFAGAAEFSAALERVLYDGEYSPTTFNMAFLMHTLFRDENEADTQAMKLEQETNFTQYLPAAGAPGGPKAKGSGRGLYVLVAAVLVVVVALFGVFYYQFQQSNRKQQLEQQSLQAKLAAFQREKEANDAKLADLAKQEEAQKTLEDMFGKQAEEGPTQEARATAKKDLETARQKTKDLARQRAEVLKEKQKLSQAQPVQAPVPVQVQAPPPPQDALPAVTHMGSPQAPRVAKESLPAALQDAEIKVSLKVFVDAAGRPLKVVILKGVDGAAGYNDSAQNAALASSFAPGTKNGKPASGWLNMEFNFGKPR